MIGYILIAIISFFIGAKWAINARLKMYEAKKLEIANLMKELKTKNNEMLSNFSTIAHATSNTEGQWTEIDEFIMPMWME